MAQQQLVTNTFDTAKWIVSANATQGTHTTIQAAITAASSGDTIFIRPGTYTENLTLKAGVNLTSYNSEFLGQVTIVGKMAMTTAGSVVVTGLFLQTNSDYILAVTGTLASNVNLVNCYLNCLNNTGISFTSSSASAAIGFYNCSGNIATTGITLFVSTSAGAIFGNYSAISNSGNTTTPSTNNAGACVFSYCQFFFPFTSTSVGMSFYYSVIATFATNAVAFTTVTTGGSALYYCYVFSGSGAGVAVGASTNVNIYGSYIQSTAAAAISGTGTIFYNAIMYQQGSGGAAATLTFGGGTLQGQNGGTVQVGFLGEQIAANLVVASAVTLVNATPKTITSINLTPGVWDVSGLGIITGGAITGTISAVGINTTTNNLGTVGANYTLIPLVPNAASDVGLTVPPIRYSFTATTTVYLVGYCGFTVGTAKAYGRISATRVG